MNRLSARYKAICSKMLIVLMLTSMLPAIHVSAAEVTPPNSDAWTTYQQYLNSNISKKEDMRATWIVTVYNSDWPSSQSLAITDPAARAEQQKKELSHILDEAAASNLNAVMFQVRPSSDALYQSDLVPWSIVMTGTPGGDPGFDPLQYAIEEAHKRGMELHAWFNPYRAATAVNDAIVAQLKGVQNSVFNTHFDWIKRATDGVYVIDPGIPEAQAWIVDTIMEVVNKYDIDGVHFDDYFYHESQAYDYDDKATFEKYKGNFTDIGDWRRNNTYTLISEVSRQIRSAKPWVQFGISPAGMWGNIKDGHVNGSPTAGGAPNYDRGFADTLRWGNEGLIDYLTPQVYWPFGRDVAPYGVIASWWADHLTNPNTKLYMGMGLYRVNDTTNATETGFLDPYAKEEIIREIQLNTNYVSQITERGIDGSFLYQSSNIVSTKGTYKKDAVEQGVRTVWANKAIAPKSSWKSSVAPAMPTNVTAEAVDAGTQVTWTSNDDNAAYYAIYRSALGEQLDTSDSTKLIAVIGKEITSYTDTAINDPSNVQYVVTALDRLHNESSPDAPTPVSAIVTEVTTAVGTQPVLPVSVKVNMTSGDPANMMVKWEKVTDPNLYSAVGTSFNVTGTVMNSNGTLTGMTATAHVTVVAPTIKYINPVIVRTEENMAPVFPATVDVIYTDNTVASLPVTWETPNPEDYKNAAPFGEYKNPSVKGIRGTVNGSDLQAEGNYIVYPAVNEYEPVAVMTRVGLPPILPLNVNATYSDGSSASVAVVWDEIPADHYASINEFTVKGTVEGAALKVEAKVTVERAVSIVGNDPVYVKTGIGVAPTLPDTVTVTYDDGTKDTVAVTWTSVDPAVDCLTTHRFTVTGTVNGTSTTVTATVEVAAVIVLDDFENGEVNSGVAQSMLQWKGDSASSTPPTLTYDTAIQHSGNSSLKVDYQFSKVASTASAYLRPNQGTGIVFEPGKVPQKIGFWVYGNNVKTYRLRAEFRAGLKYNSANKNQDIADTLNFTGWKYLEYPVDASYQETGLTITLMPGIVATSSTDKVDSTIYIDDLVAVYGIETRDTAEINKAIVDAQDLYDTTTAGTEIGQYPVSEREGLKAAIDAATDVMNNLEAVMADLYRATDSLNSAVEAYKAAQVPGVKVEAVSLDQATLQLTVGAVYQLKATIAPSDATNKNVGWTSSDDRIAAVDPTGKVTAIAEGTAVITATTEDGNKTANSVVTVSKPTTIPERNVIHVTGVSLDQQTLELNVGDESQLTATVKPSNADMMQVTWTSSNENVAIVDSAGKVVAKGSGTAIITVTTADGNMTATCVVTVISPVVEEENTKPEESVDAEDKFSDVQGHWAAASIKLATAKGIIGGYADGTFKPQSEVTRAEFAVMLARMLNLQGNGAELAFNDKAAIGSWAKQGIAQIVQAGIVKGYSDGSFRPNAEISRAEMVTMIVNALGLADSVKAATKFADDAEIPAWARAAVAVAVENGLVQGVSGNKFAPNQTATRAESVVMLIRALEFATK